VCLLFLVPAAFGDTPQALKPRDTYPNTSWALGIVVPEGSDLSDGGKVHWGSVSNVTALVVLPNITLPDRVVYTVLSAMTDDGGIIQVAAGVYPNQTSWLSYSWQISNGNAVPASYNWILNGSAPSMHPGDSITMSLFRASNSWNLGVADESTESSVVHQFPEGISPTLRGGDQEVFALEAYSKSSATFRDMGNLTLEALMLDGRNVTGGSYSYSDWDPNHTPLFAVGSSGTSPPSFISLASLAGGAFVWGYSGFWQGQTPGYGGALVTLVLVVAILVLGTGVALALSRKKPSG
jgi:hypothetical protein